MISIMTIIETYIILFFGTRINTSIIAVILETNVNEAKGFINTYITPMFYLYVLGVFIFFILLLLIRKNNKLVRVLSTKLNKICGINGVKVLLLSITMFSLFLGVFREVRNIYWYKYDIDEIGRVRKHSFYSSYYLTSSCLFDAIRLYCLSSNELPVLINSLEKTVVDSCKFHTKNIVLIIGESFNKHHSSLYGYPLKTNPCLEKEYNLFIMQDVISTDRLTSIVLKNIFSFRNKDNHIYWAESTLFPAIFKKAGYCSYLISNQEVEDGDYKDVYNMANNYLVHSRTKQYLWNIQNKQIHQYDSQLIDEYINLKNEKATYSLIIFHLLGQHTAYADRYPKEKSFFTEKDYDYRTDLNQKQKSYLAHYDNAIRYGDEVIKSIIDLFRNDDSIIIFFSDHGEEVYDYRDYMGRSHEPVITADMAKNVFEIPFFIWMSDSYIKTHADVVECVENSMDKPWIIDDLPHLLLNLAGIECDMYDPDRSLLSNKYIYSKRLIHDSMQDYDELINN